MGAVFKILFIFVCGLISGIFISQGLIILAGRNGGNFGGEILVIPLIFLLICLGIMIGSTIAQIGNRGH